MLSKNFDKIKCCWAYHTYLWEGDIQKIKKIKNPRSYISKKDAQHWWSYSITVPRFNSPNHYMESHGDGDKGNAVTHELW